jgi:hypothetical protein
VKRVPALCALLLATCALVAGNSRAEAPMKQDEAERIARERWFDFELAPLVARLHGDWAQIVAQKQAEDDRLAKAWHPSDDMEAPRTAAQARAQRVLQQEFVAVAQTRQVEIRALARRVILALQKGDVDALVDECVMYDGTAAERRALTRTFLHEQKPALQRAARLADANAADFATALSFRKPSPSTGMVGQVAIAFGPTVAAPKDAAREDLYPKRHEIELWWSGQVMPEANRPLRPAPGRADKPVSRWRFYRVVMPYSLRPRMLE